MKTTRKYYVLKNRENNKYFALEYIGDEYSDVYQWIWVDTIEAAEHNETIEKLNKIHSSYFSQVHKVIQVTETTQTTRRYKNV
jgi:hypothetical protein